MQNYLENDSKINVFALYEKTITDVAHRPEQWLEFLKTACRNYKCDLREQFLIHAVKPNATAILPATIWQKRFNRQVNGNAVKIPFIDFSKQALMVNPYIDISDTTPIKDLEDKTVPIWSYNSQYDNDIITNLVDSFNISNTSRFDTAILNVADSKQIIDNFVNIQYYMVEKENNTLLSELDDLNVKKIFRALVSKSISYMVLHRCGIDPNNYFDISDFKEITYFDDINSIVAVGQAAANGAKDILLVISNTINQQKELNYENKQGNRILHSKGEHQPEQIRSFEEKVSNRTKASSVQLSFDDRTTEQTFDRSGRKSNNESSSVGGAEEREIWSDGRTESSRPNEMGRLDEQSSSSGGGNSSNRNDLHLNNDLKTEDGSSVFSFSQQQELSSPVFEQSKQNKTLNFDLHPNIPLKNRNSFDLKTVSIENVGKKERFNQNITAINILKQCADKNRYATPDEQKALSKYVGWGGIPEAFDENNTAWTSEYNLLLSTLNSAEYNSARESTLSAFYTPTEVISSMYKVLEQMGFSNGNILEPSCGVGNFIGMLPNNMKNSKVYGVEIDAISANIAQQLYQTNTIAVQGFEEANLPDSFFDVVIGNVPFGDFKVADKKYDKHNFLIHDYFFAKSIDKVRPGGVIALITSKGTMDKKNSKVRKYIAQRAELLGAIRLPNDVFKGNAGTEVVSDILFLQKRDRIIDIEPDWVFVNTNDDGISMNEYFIQNPEMILGEMKMVSGRFGMEATCVPNESLTLQEQLENIIPKITGTINNSDLEDNLGEVTQNYIPADPSVNNFSFTVIDGTVYYRENSIMIPKNDLPTATQSRIKGMIKLRDCVKNLIDIQLQDYPDKDIKNSQNELNILYDDFNKKYGVVGSKANSTAFSQDSSYFLLTALENLDKDGNLESKSDIFYKRTIKPHRVVTSVDTSAEALAVCIGEKAHIDMEYMGQLVPKSENEIFDELKGVIFLNPLYEDGNTNFDKYVMADEYLSGNVREKLAIAKNSAQINPDAFNINVEALTKVQPKDLSASEISVRLGATWIPPKIIEQFVYEFLETPEPAQFNIKVSYSKYTSEWNVSGKNYDNYNVKANSTYGTDRINAYKIIEDTLNLKDVRIFDYNETPDGKKKAVLNSDQTSIAQAKQELIKQGFKDWIWSDPTRREELTKSYNENFNNIRPREYDGSHIEFYGINSQIELQEHQKNAVAHILYGGNTLLAHCVGAGKTFEMTAAAMEMKRLGLCNKPLFVVPNHLTEQWATEFLNLYPSANILVATKKEFETKNRKRFCGRIATGEYDAIIMGHSQFEKIPISIERQRAMLEQQIDEISAGIVELSNKSGTRFSVKRLEKQRKQIRQKLKKLNDQSRKDDVVTFEQLGIDRLFIDESHYYKNLYLYTKMRNVGGIAQTEAQKSSDLFMKCRYLDEITGGKGIVFATGTPISNSMVELYTIQRYLQYNTLQKRHLQHFDAWASTFGETVSAIELTPEGTGYRAKTRFSKFYNLPELMSMFKEVADIKTADVLNLPVPKANFHNVSVKPSEFQKKMVSALADRAEKIRNGKVDSSIDNMLLITNDGRKVALDQRIINPSLPDFEGSKVNNCVENVYKIWNDTIEQKSTQLIFCDLSTPHIANKVNDDIDETDFTNIYDDIRNKLIIKGIPKNEIAFIHEAKTEKQKDTLFQAVRDGDVRILIGSTQKLGAGTNVQDRLIALHDIDCPWRPSDLEQRAGRIVRQGNMNDEVNIYRYVTEQTFDAYLYQLVEGKQKFASQIMTSKSPVRSAEDIDETALSYAEIKMLATGNPLIKEKMDLDIQVQKLKLLKSSFLTEKYSLEDKIIKFYPQEIAQLSQTVAALEFDVQQIKEQPKPKYDGFVGMNIMNVHYSDKREAGKAIFAAFKQMTTPQDIPLGEYRKFKLDLSFNPTEREYEIVIKGTTTHRVFAGNDSTKCINRIDKMIDRIPEMLKKANDELSNVRQQYQTAQDEVKKAFPQDEELTQKLTRLVELNNLLSVDKMSTSSSKSDTSDDNKMFVKADENQKDILIQNGYDDYKITDEGKYIFRYSAEKDEEIKNLLNGQCNSNTL